jgi:hypothetical protein
MPSLLERVFSRLLLSSMQLLTAIPRAGEAPRCLRDLEPAPSAGKARCHRVGHGRDMLQPPGMHRICCA